MNQVGTVLVFKPGVTPEEAEKALKQLKDVIDPNYSVEGTPAVREFDPSWGGPVWYVP